MIHLTEQDAQGLQLDAAQKEEAIFGFKGAMPLKSKITCISIDCYMLASPSYGFYVNTRVSIHRGEKVEGFDTNSLTHGNISNASVIRAKRAQLALVKRGQRK